jgi:alcohol dehydrogenase class IV
METSFRAATYACRIHSGKDALDNLPRELNRLGVKRPFILCGQSVSNQTNLIDRLKGLLGDTICAIYDELPRNAPLESVLAARDLARTAKADSLIAVGAGTAIMTGRSVVIMLAETEAPEELMTQYASDRPAKSPRLTRPKIPIINILTAPTNAQNRGGAAVKNDTLTQRMEFFDPKTRPASIFWDEEALATAPLSLAFSASLATFWWSLMAIGTVPNENPLVQADRSHAFELALSALPRIQNVLDSEARILMCAAAFLQNRDEDDGGRLFEATWVSRACYALGAGILLSNSNADPGMVYIALTGPAITHFGNRNPTEISRISSAIGHPIPAAAFSPDKVRENVSIFFRKLGVTPRLRDVGVARETLSQYRDFALRNFNADRNRQFLSEMSALTSILEEAW